MKNCNCDSDITRDGSGQLQRYLRALDPSYAPIDGRSVEQMLVFAKKYAEEIRFYDIPGSMTDNAGDAKKISWKEFFRRDMAIVIAGVALTDPATYKKKFENAVNELALQPSTDHFADLFKPILEMLKKIDQWYSIAIPDNPLYKDLVLAINSVLLSQARQIMAYKKEFNVVDPNTPLPINFDGIENADLWGIYQPFDVEGNLYEGNTAQEKIKYAALYVEDVFYSFYNVLSQLKSNADKYFDYAIQEYPGHQPHMALFISFLELFRIAQEQMNGLTERMLDFYYREVLHLAAKNSIPDRAHIVFELAKEATTYDLLPGTELNGGKDELGKDQVYTTSGELVVNQAKIKELSTLFIEKDQPAFLDVKRIRDIHARKMARSKDGLGEEFTSTNPKWPTFGNIERPSRKNSLCDDLIADKESLTDTRGRIGIAVASPQLLLQGGKRLIQIELQTPASKAKAGEPGNLFDQLILSLSGIEIFLSGEKGWIKTGTTQDGFSKDQQDFIDLFFKKGNETIYPVHLDPERFYFIDDRQRLNIYLPMSEQPIVPFNAKLHDEYNFETSYPVMMILNRPGSDLNIPEDVFTEIQATNFSIRTKVGSIFPDPKSDTNFDSAAFKTLMSSFGIVRDSLEFDGLRKLILQNELRVLPEAAPFDPFTSLPESGKPFYIGSSEVFNRPLDKLAVFIRKTQDIKKKGSGAGDISEKEVPEEYSVNIRENRRWLELCDIRGVDFNRNDLLLNILRHPVKTADGKVNVETKSFERGPLVQVEEWKEGMETGFLRFDNLLTIASNDDNHLLKSQNAAHTLEIKEVSVSYDSTLKLQKGIDMLFHVYPFGVTEIKIAAAAAFKKSDESLKEVVVTAYGKDEKEYPLTVDNNRKLLPQFTHLDPYAEIGSLETEDNSTIRRKKIVEQERRKQSTQYSGSLQQEGMLFIGLENAEPLQNISLLFQFAEGSAGDEDNPSPDIIWSYLVYNKWQPLSPEDLVSDGTYGFQTTGIVNISIPAEANLRHTIMTDGLTWLCASVNEHSERIPMLIDIVTQAVEVKFDDRQNAISHFDNALAAGSISKLSTPVAEISAVKQPFASFDGKHREIGKEFYTRVSERLRHKHRAVTAWDYEHLVLDRFPSVYKVKCLTHTDPECLCREPLKPSVIKVPADAIINAVNVSFAEDSSFSKLQTKLKDLVADTLIATTGITKVLLITGYYDHSKPEVKKTYFSLVRVCVGALLFMKVGESLISIQTIDDPQRNELVVQELNNEKLQLNVKKTCCGPQVSPGHVLMVPIANLKNRNAVNPLQPKTSRRTLLEIESYLKKYTSPFVKIHAKNPVYEQILVVFKVKFYSGTDKGFYLKKLNKEIVHFLTPWAFDENAEVKFGQKIYASAIINFIEEREYVDFITDFVMYICRNECCPPDATDTTDDADKNWLDSVSSCCDMERLIKNDDLEGDVIAKPSTARSILVSVPQHRITLYVEPPQLTPCEKLAQSKPVVLKLKGNTAPGIIANRVSENAPVAMPVRESTAAATSTAVNPATAIKATAESSVKPVKKAARKDAGTKGKNK